MQITVTNAGEKGTMALTEEEERMLQQLGRFIDYSAMITKSRLCKEWAKDRMREVDG